MNFFAFSFLPSLVQPHALDGASFFSQIVDILFSGSADLMGELGSLLRTAINGLIYADGVGTSPEFSTVFILILTLVGISIVFGLVFGTFAFIKSSLRRTGNR